MLRSAAKMLRTDRSVTRSLFPPITAPDHGGGASAELGGVVPIFCCYTQGWTDPSMRVRSGRLGLEPCRPFGLPDRKVQCKSKNG